MWTVSQLCPEMTPISGHVYRFEGARGPVWRANGLLPVVALSVLDLFFVMVMEPA
jgi:hypothetical protein